MGIGGEDIEAENLFTFWRNFSLILVFFLLTPVTLATSLFSLASISEHLKTSKDANQNQTSILLSPKSGVKVYASLPDAIPSVLAKAETNDARAEIIRQYLTRYNSPLAPYSEFLVATADRYSLDFRLLVAIAQQESNLCKKIPAGTFNCWGWGIHSQGTLGFTSYEEGIEQVAKGIKEEYIDKGLTSPEEIMSKYTPLSNGSWALGVKTFMAEME